MYMGYYEEGDKCREKDCKGTLEYPEVENCSCHINPPCQVCTNNPLTCNECGWEEEAPDYKDVQVAPGLSMREYKPLQLDKTKIDYRSKMHSSSTMIKEGVYPDGATKTEVQKVVNGTFGGRFEEFGNGRFKFVAYTD
jgi:hypothetical protein